MFAQKFDTFMSESEKKKKQDLANQTFGEDPVLKDKDSYEESSMYDTNGQKRNLINLQNYALGRSEFEDSQYDYTSNG